METFRLVGTYNSVNQKIIFLILKEFKIFQIEPIMSYGDIIKRIKV